MRKLKCSEVKWLPQGHPASNCQAVKLKSKLALPPLSSGEAHSLLFFKYIFCNVQMLLLSFTFFFLHTMEFYSALKRIFLNWKIIALPCRAGVCCPTTWIRHGCLYESLWRLPPTSAHLSRSSHSARPGCLCCTAAPRSLSVSRMTVCIYQCCCLICPTLSFPCCAHRPLLCFYI